MAIYHLSVGSVTRSTGRSSVQAVAYLTSTRLMEERRGLIADYTHKEGEVSWETMAPEWANIDKKDLTIWNKLENYEDEYAPKRYANLQAREKYLASAVTAHTYVFALPKELTKDQNTFLIQNIIQERFVDNGLVATWAIHWEEGNPHAHILVSERAIEPDGTFSYYKVARDLSRREGLRETRKLFADKTNALFASLGMEERIDHRSYAERGINLIPTQHKGWWSHHLERDGFYSRIGKENVEVSEANKERVSQEPEIILKELISTQATFSEMDVIRLAQKRMKDDPSFLTQHVIESVIKEAVEVGTGINSQKRYTTQDYFDREAKILEAFEGYLTSKAAIKIEASKVDALLGKLEEQGKETGIIPTEGQVSGIRTLCGDSRLSVMIGRAGTGKTTTLKPVVQLHQEAGYKVWGMAPSATAATQLEADTGCKSDTIAHYAYYWKEYDRAVALLQAATTDKEERLAQKAITKYSKYLPDDNTLVLVDEAGMVGVGNAVGAIPGGWDAITKALGNSKAKLILTGDDHQFKPIEAGDVFRRLVHQLRKEEKSEGDVLLGDGLRLGGDFRSEARLQLCELGEIKRQNVPWMQEASHHLAELNVATALGLYEQAGHIQEHASNVHVYEDMARQYLRNITSQPDSKGIVIAATNEERQALNREIRSVLKENSLLPKEDLLVIGEDGYAVGDKIIFLKNDRGWNTSFQCQKEGFFVQNNMHAIIQSIKQISVEDKSEADPRSEADFRSKANTQSEADLQKQGEKTETSGTATYGTRGSDTSTNDTTTFEIVAYVPDHEATIRFTLNNYKAFAHSYAVTGWKSQGNTLDWSLVKISRYLDAHGLYVALTRHREDLSIYYSKEDFPDYASLVHSLGKVNVKDLVVDYTISDENKEYWKNVQDYKEAGFELLGVSTLARSLDKKEEIEAVWQNYRHIEEERRQLAKLILSDRETHKDYVRQAGLTFETLEIAAGLKKRPLGRLEAQAQIVVEQYVAVSLEARKLWRDIRRTHPGIRAKTHPEWQKFEDARDQRGILANQIHLNPTLHSPFLKETADAVNVQMAKGYVPKNHQNISYGLATIKAQAEAHQSKMLREQLLKDHTNPIQQDRLRVLAAYTEARDHCGQIWQEIRPKLKNLEGTLLEGSLSKEISEYTEIRMKRDHYAARIMEGQEAYVQTAEKVGIKLDIERLEAQAAIGNLDSAIITYKSSHELTTKLGAAARIHSLMKQEQGLGKKPMVSEVFQQGIQPKDIARDALEWQKMKVFEGLNTEQERNLFLLLDEYGDKCRTANALYAKCATDVKSKSDGASLSRPWQSIYYGDYKSACEARNAIALEVFDQRDQSRVLSLAEAMGMRFKDVELEEIFSRCEQATRTRHITAYLKAETPEAKGEAAISIRQMIAFERTQGIHTESDAKPQKPSVTAQQAFHSGIDFKDLQATAFAYGRACAFKTLSTPEETKIFHTLELYEQTCRASNKMYGECIEESKARTTKDLAVKPWETDKFKDYISLVTVRDEQAYQLIKEHPASSLEKVAKEMGISIKSVDVDAHRHSLRKTLQTFTEGDRTNVPMAAYELLNWLDFDRHGDHKHTFKVLREQDIWPKNIQESLQEFFEKKRELRHEAKRDLKGSAIIPMQRPPEPEYKIITYGRQQSFEEIDRQLKEQMHDLATSILGNPSSRTSTQLRFGKKGSISVFTNGAKKGLYANHETGVYGGPLKLIEDQIGLSSSKDARTWASDWLGGNPFVIEKRAVEKSPSPTKASTWTPVVPVPGNVEAPDISGNKYLNYMLKDGNKETARYAYRDEQGKLKGYVFRFERPNPEDPEGKNIKMTPPLAYCENERGFRCWKWQGFFGEEKTPYGLEKLMQDPRKPVLVVEGEKKADAAQKMLPEYHVLGWIGGAGSVGKTNWEFLVGKAVAIWPDNDSGGIKAAENLKKIVTSLNEKKSLQGVVGVVALPDYLPEKWDLADRLPEGWTVDTVKEMVREAVPFKDKAVVMATEVEGRPPDTIKPDTHEKNYTSQETKILDYLRQELTPEKTPWLDESDFKKFLKAATENPAHTLQRWQKITDDYSFEVTADEQSKTIASEVHPIMELNDEQKAAIKLQGQEILAYLNDEVRVDKHGWLSHDYVSKILESAKDDPFTALDRWKDVSGDSSFEPSLPEALMTEDQKTIKYSILAYLREDMQSIHRDSTFDAEGRPPIDGKTQQKILKLAEGNPNKGLQEWQLLTENYDFNPYAPSTGMRELKVNEYLQEKLGEQNHKLGKNARIQITDHLHSNPLKAYDVWQLYTQDKTFDPQTGIPAIETQAQSLMNSIKTPIPHDLLQSWQDQIISHPESVIKQCQEFIQARETQDMFQKNVRQFIKLSETHEELRWDDPKIKKIDAELEKITGRYLNDKNFIKEIEGSKSQAASERLSHEIKQRDRELSRNMGDRGMGM